jgi:N-acylneuraminate cytidylyltransferase
VNIISIIPARSGSKGIIHKNLQELGGKKLLEWSIRLSLKTKNINRTIVSTDSQEYARICESFGAEVPFIRPNALATDTSTDFEFMLHAIEELESRNQHVDFIVHLRPTTPIRDPRVVDDAISKFVKSDGKYTALRSVHEMSESAYKTFEISNNGSLVQVCSHNPDIENSNNARQTFPKTYSPNGYVDIISVPYLKTERKIHGNHVLAYLTDRVLEVDNQFDLEILNTQLELNPAPFLEIFGEADEQF